MTAQALADASTRRARLCSRENAHRLASRLFEERREAVRVVRTSDPERPYRVLHRGERAEGEVELEIRLA